MFLTGNEKVPSGISERLKRVWNTSPDCFMIRLVLSIIACVTSFHTHAQPRQDVQYAFQIIGQKGEEQQMAQLTQNCEITIGIGMKHKASVQDQNGVFDSIHHCIIKDQISYHGRTYVVFDWPGGGKDDIRFVEFKMIKGEDSMVIFYYGVLPPVLFVDSIQFFPEYTYIRDDLNYKRPWELNLETEMDEEGKFHHVFNGSNYYHVGQLEDYRPYRMRMQVPNGRHQIVISAPGTHGYYSDSIRYKLRFNGTDSIFCELIGLQYDPKHWLKTIAGMGEEISMTIDLSSLEPGKYYLTLQDALEKTTVHISLQDDDCTLSEGSPAMVRHQMDRIQIKRR